MGIQAASPKTLVVDKFSCIDNAVIRFGPVTIIIGAQGSGKSVLCKIFYFCQLPFSLAIDSVIEGESYKEFIKSLEVRFESWFPVAAWGLGQFNIACTGERYVINIRRIKKRSIGGDRVSIDFSSNFELMYDSMSKEFARHRKERLGDRAESFRDRYYYSYAFRREAESIVRDTFGSDVARDQLYIPAGRAFFTTVGKTVAAFDQVNLLDPITAAFGRKYLSLREDAVRSGAERNYYYGAPKKVALRMSKFRIHEIFGGKIKPQKGEFYVQTFDNRIVPVTALSSGQQELLPLWLAVQDFAHVSSWYKKDLGSSILYIEEPEAHLFPSAQARLMRYLLGMLSPQTSTNSLIITTHSPYILLQVNNLIKAGQVGFKRRLPTQLKVREVYDKDLWLPAGIVDAYQLIDRSSGTLMDESGMISAEYIDSVSSDMLEDYERLLDIEFGS